MARQLDGERCGCGNEPGSLSRVGLGRRGEELAHRVWFELGGDIRTDPTDGVCTLAHFC